MNNKNLEGVYGKYENRTICSTEKLEQTMFDNFSSIPQNKSYCRQENLSLKKF